MNFAIAVFAGPQNSEAPLSALHFARAVLASGHQIELIVCVASALRRGILDATESERYEKSDHNLAPGFEISGLGQLIDSSLSADRLVTFK